MSLDLILESPTERKRCTCSNCGHEHDGGSLEYFSSNITHNLAPMFGAAGVYEILWHGDGLRAGDVLPKIRVAIADMVARPEVYRRHDSPNGWGTYANAVPWLARVARACEEHPDAVLRCAR